MPLYMDSRRLQANDQMAAEARTADLSRDIERQVAEATAPEPPEYTLPTLGQLGVSGAANPVTQAIASMPAIGQRVQQAAEPAVSWALPTLESLGVTQPRPQRQAVSPQTSGGDGTFTLEGPTTIPGPDQTDTGAPVRSAAEMSADVRPVQPGEIDNSSRASFARTAYPYALRAAGGNPELANRLIASAISENGTVGAGGPIGVGFNFGGIKHDPDAAGSGTYATWEQENGQRVDQPASFAHYRSVQEGFDAIPRFLQRNFPKQWAEYQRTGDAAGLYRAINAGGYATDQGWSQTIESIAANQVAPHTRGLATAASPAAAPQAAAPQSMDGAPVRVVPMSTPNTGGKRQATRGIVVHSTRGQGADPADEFKKTLDWFANPKSEVSAHAVIAADGTIAQVGDWDVQTWHAGENNADRIGIELVQSAADNDRGVPFTDAQYRSLAWLTSQLSKRYGFGIDRSALVGHEELEQGHRHGKTDPGKSFDWNRYQQEARGYAGQPVAQNAGASPPPAAPAPAAPPSSAAGATSSIGQAATAGDPLAMKTSEIGVPMPENPADAPQEGYSNPDLTPMPAPPVTVAPLPDDAMYRQPLAAQPEFLPGDGGTAPVPEYVDPDQGPREATPGSVGASPPVYDPRVQDEAPGARELPVQPVAVEQAPVGGQDDPGTQVAAAPEPASDIYYPGSPIIRQGQRARAAQEEARAVEPAPAPSLTQDVIPAAIGAQPGAVSKAVEAAVKAYNDPIWASVPAPARATKIIQDAGNAYGDEVGRSVGRALGLSDEDTMSLLGIPFSQQDVAGTVGSVLTDPTNYVGATLADPVLTVAKGAVRDFVPDVVQGVVRRAGSAASRAGEVLEQGRATARAAEAQGGMSLPGVFGALPPSSGRPTVEVLQDRIGTVNRLIDEARAAGNATDAAELSEVRAILDGQMVDAQNARRALEPAIRSDVGRQANPLVLTEESADTLTDAMRPVERVSPELAADLGGPVSVPPRSISLNAGFGGLPEEGATIRRGGAPMEPKPGKRLDSEWVYHNTRGEYVDAIASEGLSGGSFSERPIDFGGDVWIAVRKADLPEPEIHDYGGVRAYEPTWDVYPNGDSTQFPETRVIPAERAVLVDKRGRVIRTLGSGPTAVEPPGAVASAGALPSTTGSGALGAFNRAAGEVIAGGTGGAVIEQARNPDEDPRIAAARGFALGAVGFPAATRGARALARRAGAVAPEAGGALASLGHLPDDAPRYRPELAREPVLPGMEPPPRARESLPDISDEPNVGSRPGMNVGAPTEMLPGFERIDPLTDPVRPGTSGVQVPEQTMAEALPGLLRREAAPPLRTTAAVPVQAPLLETPRGPLRRAAAAISDAVGPWANRVNIGRFAGMLSAPASQVANIVPSAIMQGVDALTTPVAAAIDAGRVGAMRAVGKQAEREVFLSEVPARLQGMRTGVGIGLEAATDVLKTGLRPEDAAKLEQRSGFATNIPGLAPAGSRRAAAVDAAAEAPLRMLAAADAVFRTTALGGHLMAEATAAATKAAGGKPVTDAMVREAAKRPEVVERATYLARRTVLQEDRLVTDWYRQAMNYRPDDPIARLAADTLRAGVSVEVPFVRTPYNVVAQGMGLTPAGLLGLAQDIKMGKSAREMEHRLARVAIGTAVMGVAAADYAAGNLTGPYPSDPKEASTLPPGWRAWSRKVTNPATGETVYIPLAYLGPLALPPVAAILAGEAHKKGKTTLSPEWTGTVAAGVGRYAAQETFIEGIAGIAKLFDQRTGEATAARHVEQIAAQFSPHILGGGALGREIQRVMGMPARDPEGALEALLATHPLQDQIADATGRRRVEPRQDVLGRPASLGLSGPAGAVIRGGVEKDAGVIAAYREAGEGLPTAAPKSIRNPAVGGTQTLSPTERHRWREAFGAALEDGWMNIGMTTDPARLKKLEEQARSRANDVVLGVR